jgi:predicted TIM-barrel fold metal-dependent hydrolase
MRTYLSFVNGLGLPPEGKEKILWRNAARLFRIDVGQPNNSVAPRG